MNESAPLSESTWVDATAVALGAALGALARWRVGVALANVNTMGFPLGTLIVNAVGGLLIGVALAVLPRHGWWSLLLVTGVLGGFTTFSAFSAESLQLLQRGQAALALLHTAAHVLGSLACAGLGFLLARAVIRH